GTVIKTAKMKVDLTNETVEGEPGPNLYFMGSVSDFQRLAGWIEKLVSKEETDFFLNDVIEGLEINPTTVKINLKSSEDGRILSEIEGLTVTINLDTNYWKRILQKVLNIAAKPCFDYIDSDVIGFKDTVFREDCNVIMSSEW